MNRREELEAAYGPEMAAKLLDWKRRKAQCEEMAAQATDEERKRWWEQEAAWCEAQDAIESQKMETRCPDCNAAWRYETEQEKELAVEALWSHACQR